jgi:hypothetical protein
MEKISNPEQQMKRPFQGGSDRPATPGLHRWFIVSAALILVVTGLAKLLSTGGDGTILRVADPVFGLPFRRLMQLAGGAEIMVAFYCFFGRSTSLSTLLVVWLASGFLLYRIANWMIGWERPCGCLGNLTDALGISSLTAEWISLALLGYLIGGGYGVLLQQLGQLKSERICRST